MDNNERVKQVLQLFCDELLKEDWNKYGDNVIAWIELCALNAIGRFHAWIRDVYRQR